MVLASCSCNLSLPRTRKNQKRALILGVVLSVLGFGLLLVGVFVGPALREFLDSELQKAKILDNPDSDAFKIFADNSDYPITVKIFVMNITNPHDVLEKGVKPKVEEIGPFVYHQYKIAFNISFSDNREKLRWKYYSYFIFDEAASVQHDSMLLTQLNPTFWALAANLKIDDQGKNYLVLIYDVLAPLSMFDRVFITGRSVRELIFGYVDPVMEVANGIDPNIDKRFPGFLVNHTSLEHAESIAKYDEIWTGAGDIKRLREYIKWQEMDYIITCPLPPCPPNPEPDAWATREAGRIFGTDGALFKTDVKRSDKLPMWYPSYYRTIEMVYKHDSSHKGIDTYRFGPPLSAALNATLNPENGVYYQFGSNNVYNVTSLANKTPLFLTEPRYASTGSPMKDDVEATWLAEGEDHSTRFDVEPITGGSINIYTATQAVEPIYPLMEMPILGSENKTNWFENMRTGYVPIFWASNEIGISDEDAKKFRDGVYGALVLADASKYTGYIGGSLFLICGLVLAIGSARKMRSEHDGRMRLDSDLEGGDKSEDGGSSGSGKPRESSSLLAGNLDSTTLDEASAVGGAERSRRTSRHPPEDIRFE